eukprot:9658639-Karenia_brevis.AAC.1
MAEVTVVRLLEPQRPVYRSRLTAVVRDGVLQSEIANDFLLGHLERLALGQALVVDSLEAHGLAYLHYPVAQT